jgi:quercetin dioxygenase-like cupin family protein
VEEIMSDRRDFLVGVAAAMATVIAAREAHGAPPQANPIVQRDAPPVNLEGWQMTATEVSYGPGESSNRHRHPGFVCGYVLEGQYRFAVDGQPETVLKAGEMFFENPGDVHAVSGNASTTRPARILAIVFTKKGDPVTIPG